MIKLRKEKRKMAFQKKRPIWEPASSMNKHIFKKGNGNDTDEIIWDLEKGDIISELEKVYEGSLSQKQCFDICHDKDLLLFLSSRLEDYWETTSNIGIEEKEEITSLIWRILLEASYLSEYDTREFINYSYFGWKFGKLLKNWVKKSSIYLTNLYSKISELKYSKDILIHSGIIARGLRILTNYLFEDSFKFYEFVTDTEMHGALFSLIAIFNKFGNEIEHDWITFVFSNYADTIFCLNSLIQSTPFDVIETSLNSIDLILTSIYPPTQDAIIKTDIKDYEQIILYCLAAFAEICTTQDDGIMAFCEDKNKLKTVIEIGFECLK